jgi:hypothetical protein
MKSILERFERTVEFNKGVCVGVGEYFTDGRHTYELIDIKVRVFHYRMKDMPKYYTTSFVINEAKNWACKKVT